MYETETDRIRKWMRMELTTRQRATNWWFYHRIHVLIAAAVLALGLFFFVQSRGVPDADYCVAYVGAKELDADAVSFLTAQLARYGKDMNGDGQVIVDLHPIIIDFAAVLKRGGIEGQSEQAAMLALEGDFNVGQSTIFLLDAPEAFQQFTGALISLDGSELPEDAGAKRFAKLWNNCAALAPFDGGDSLYLSCKGCWRDSQRERWEASRALWNNVIDFSEEPL